MKFKIELLYTDRAQVVARLEPRNATETEAVEQGLPILDRRSVRAKWRQAGGPIATIEEGYVVVPLTRDGLRGYCIREDMMHWRVEAQVYVLRNNRKHATSMCEVKVHTCNIGPAMTRLGAEQFIFSELSGDIRRIIADELCGEAEFFLKAAQEVLK